MDFKLVNFLFYISLMIEITVVSSETQSKTMATCGSPGIPGMPGVPGSPGGNGSPSSPGANGVKGEPGVKGKEGIPGIPGKYGMPGSPGSVGVKGEPGVSGNPGRNGIPGSPGSVGMKGEPGVPGNPGRKGMQGSPGRTGGKGEPGDRGHDYAELSKSNWKQCVWKRTDSKNTGLIQNCVFKKKYDDTSLRVIYAGNLRSDGSAVCNRWYFTFGDAECTQPATIDGVVFTPVNTENPLRHRHIEGFCNKIPKGQVRVGFWIGKCVGQTLGSGATGWNSMSRIVIEEVAPPQT